MRKNQIALTAMPTLLLTTTIIATFFLSILSNLLTGLNAIVGGNRLSELQEEMQFR
ncbi:hypothetical protein [Dolosigranulum pigrum]|uniref:hypothetical protein n=1 Tax=Dolosigranulum pigrum TaxID=29394 RepID=UPI001AD86A9E|nr:hypothetical protein [Dolosigranulum pigrum]